MPKLVITSDKAVDGEFTNPYAMAKARAAFEIASAVAMVNVKGCFMTKEWEKYIPIVSSAHEMMRVAAVLCDEARELEKSVDGVIRKPHKKDGVIVSKTKLISKPE
jgi:methylenetetrahydromethanopterin dehydrogenase